MSSEFNPTGSGEFDPGDPVKPAPFLSDPGSVSFPLTLQVLPKSRIKSYQAISPSLYQYMNDGRLSAPYKGQAARLYTNWAFNAVRTVDASGHDRSIVRMTVNIETLWNPIRPWDKVWMSNSGRNISFRKGGQVLLKLNDAANTTGWTGICKGTDTLVENPLDIPNDVFEAMTDITVEALPELFFACP
jgi:hypothetical protein